MNRNEIIELLEFGKQLIISVLDSVAYSFLQITNLLIFSAVSLITLCTKVDTARTALPATTAVDPAATAVEIPADLQSLIKICKNFFRTKYVV